MSEPTLPPQPTQLTQADLQQIIMSALAAQKAEHDEEVKRLLAEHDATSQSLQAQVTALQQSLVGNVPVLIPEHAGGPGTEVHASWSKLDQERAYAAAEAARVSA